MDVQNVCDFSRNGDAVAIPDLIQIQTESYESFLQEEIAYEKRKDHGLEGVLKEIFPIKSYDGTISLLSTATGDKVFEKKEFFHMNLWEYFQYIQSLIGGQSYHPPVNMEFSPDGHYFAAAAHHGFEILDDSTPAENSTTHRPPSAARSGAQGRDADNPSVIGV